MQHLGELAFAELVVEQHVRVMVMIYWTVRDLGRFGVSSEHCIRSCAFDINFTWSAVLDAVAAWCTHGRGVATNLSIMTSNTCDGRPFAFALYVICHQLRLLNFDSEVAATLLLRGVILRIDRVHSFWVKVGKRNAELHLVQRCLGMLIRSSDKIFR